ncbi:MAG: hypothetical protein O8C58_06005 [Candidatus Methanoperedens sp.]|nr:hypothetical protein [Candidatus Methanoperedens sp.]
MKITKVRNGYILYKTINGKTQQLLLDISDVMQFVEILKKDIDFKRMWLDVD